jgi:hypothetical protein
MKWSDVLLRDIKTSYVEYASMGTYLFYHANENFTSTLL